MVLSNKPSKSRKKIRAQFQLVIGLIMIWLFVTQLGDIVTTVGHNPVIRYAEDHQIDSGALFYTESEQGIEANFLMLKED